MKRWLVGVVAALAALVFVGPAQADPPGKLLGSANAQGWYLQLGDSLATGYQPDVGDDLDGGYADDVLAAIQGERPKTKLRNLGCAGENVATFIDGGRCEYEEGSQLEQALQFLHAHGERTRVITVTIGANDVVGCVLGGTVDEACLAAGMARVSERLPGALEALRAAAPDAEIVVLNYYNPVLAAWLTGPEGQRLAELSMGLQAQLNAAIARAAAAAGAEVADVAGAFASGSTAPTALPGGGEAPTNVARICELTWMCARADIHANDAGYELLGEAVASRLRD